jgi:hypothetical protein
MTPTSAAGTPWVKDRGLLVGLAILMGIVRVGRFLYAGQRRLHRRHHDAGLVAQPVDDEVEQLLAVLRLNQRAHHAAILRSVDAPHVNTAARVVVVVAKRRQEVFAFRFGKRDFDESQRHRRLEKERESVRPLENHQFIWGGAGVP